MMSSMRDYIWKRQWVSDLFPFTFPCDFKWLEYTHLNEISGVATTIGAGRRLKN